MAAKEIFNKSQSLGVEMPITEKGLPSALSRAPAKTGRTAFAGAQTQSRSWLEPSFYTAP